MPTYLSLLVHVSLSAVMFLKKDSCVVCEHKDTYVLIHFNPTHSVYLILEHKDAYVLINCDKHFQLT